MMMTSHRLPVRNKSKVQGKISTPPIIASFINRDTRNQIYANRKLTRSLDLTEFSVEGITHLYVNENLTQHRKKNYSGSLNKRQKVQDMDNEWKYLCEEIKGLRAVSYKIREQS